MTIVYCIFSLGPPGGMQRALTVKANYLADVLGYSVHIVTRTPRYVSPQFPLSPHVRVHHTGRPYRGQLTKLLYTIRPDITISLYGEESRFLYKIADGSKKVLEFHFTRNHLVHLVKGLPNIRFRGLRLQYARLLQYLDERCAPRYHRLVLLTEGDRQLWGDPPNAVVIPNPLSFESSRKSDLRNKRVLSVGRLIATKGFDLLIDAYRLVAVKHPDWKLTILGEGQDRDFLLGKIRDYGLEAHVEILPPTADIIGELLRTAIYAAPSRYEGFGLMIMEAMECGVPSVAFDCECGPREIITHGVDGMLVEAQDSAKFGESLLQLVESREIREILGHNARISARKFALDKVMHHWKKLFNSLVEIKAYPDVQQSNDRLL